MLTVPIWEYPAEARRRARRTHVSAAYALQQLLAVPVHIRTADGPVGVTVPSETIQSTGVSVDEYVASYALLRDMKLMTWDSRTHTHVRLMPET
ncbi:hypothetical protein OR221_3219 [Microbacterium laevaniformans OR221]|nr:hypothetical protein OR221_3219 [Microbacterium laevaniformans OR221]